MSQQSWKFNRAREDAPQSAPAITADMPPSAVLSGRALNVLKELSGELTGASPPRGAWCPPDELLCRLTAEHLGRARNCGPRTTREIIAWAATRGVVIEISARTSRSLSAVWQDLAAEAAARKLTKAEITAALERSIRRKSARIPIAFQIVLLKILSSTYE